MSDTELTKRIAALTAAIAAVRSDAKLRITAMLLERKELLEERKRLVESARNGKTYNDLQHENGLLRSFQALALYRTGITQAEVGKRMGIKPSRAAQLIHKAERAEKHHPK